MGMLIVIGWRYLTLRVTGHPLEMPVMLHEKTYAVTQPFLWQPPLPDPAYRHKSMRDCEVGWMLPVYNMQRASFEGLYSASIDKLALYANSAFQGCAVVIVIALFFARRDRFLRFALAMLVLFTGVLLAATWSQPHY